MMAIRSVLAPKWTCFYKVALSEMQHFWAVMSHMMQVNISTTTVLTQCLYTFIDISYMHWPPTLLCMLWKDSLHNGNWQISLAQHHGWTLKGILHLDHCPALWKQQPCPHKDTCQEQCWQLGCRHPGKKKAEKALLTYFALSYTMTVNKTVKQQPNR